MTAEATKPLKIIFYCSPFTGPQNACIGLGEVLLRRQHEVYFFSTPEFRPKFLSYGFKVLELEPGDDTDADQNEDFVKAYTKKLLENPIMKDASAAEKVIAFKDLNFVGDMQKIAEDFDPQIKRHLEKTSFDTLVIDSEVMPPSLAFSHKKPWAYLYCSHPIGLFCSPKLPPPLSDFPTNSDREKWGPFSELVEKYYFSKLRQAQRELCIKFGYPAASGDPFVLFSPYLCFYQYPAELDYQDVIEIPARFFRIDALCREKDANQQSFQIPDYLSERMKPGDRLVYLSLGSMGSCNVDLMRRLIGILATTKHWYIVSKGKFHDQFELAENMWGEEYVPQTQILPLVDAAILHGGNNGFTEAMYAGKPVIVMPLFYDQFHNAQRAVEKGVGLTLNPFRCSKEQLTEALDRILGEPEFRTKTETIARNIRERKSKEKACEKIEELVNKARKE